MGWEDTMSKKDESLKQTSSIGKAMPPVRNSPSPADGAAVGASKQKKGKGKASAAAAAAAKKKAIPGGDFRAWDKFDVDAALDEMDADDGPSQEEQEETEEYRAQKLREYRATEEKEKGNAQYKKGKCLAAIACYTRAIEHDPKNAVYPANRAMAHLKMKHYIDAVQDCTIAVKLDKKYTKAWLRRGTALVSMGSFEEAIPDFEHVLKLDPTNASAKKELASLPKRIADKKAKARKAFRPLEHMGDNTTMSKGKSGKPMHRIAIEDIGSSDEEEAEDDNGGSGSSGGGGGEGAAAASASAPAEVLKGSPMIAMVDTPAEISPSPLLQSSTAQPPSSPPPPANASPAAAAATAAAAAAAAAADAEKAAVSANCATKAPPPTAAATEKSATAVTTATATTAAAGSGDGTAAAPSPSPKAPAKPNPAAVARKKAAAARRAATAAAASRSASSPTRKKAGLTPGKFSVEWRKWRKNPTKLFAFFQSFDQKRLHTLLKSSLDADFFADLLGLVKASCIPEGYPVFDTLDSLRKADRFDMVIMMIEDTEASILKEVFASMRQAGSALAGGASTEDVARLASSYDV